MSAYCVFYTCGQSSEKAVNRLFHIRQIFPQRLQSDLQFSNVIRLRIQNVEFMDHGYNYMDQLHM